MPSTNDVVTADAPGRVNLIGEHTDYHHGFVLPTVIPQRTRVHLVRRSGRRIRVSSEVAGLAAGEYRAGEERPGRGWLDYVQGVTATLARHGVGVPGLDIRIASDVPVGAGVSSSAALQVSLLRGLRELLGLTLDDLTLARFAQQAETDFAGTPVGIMDQIASSLGREGEALFVDTHRMEIERVPLPESLALLVIHSGTSHSHAGGEYLVRRRESFEAAVALGVERLGQLTPADLPRLDRLPDLLARRARHVVTENARVLQSVEALRRGDAVRLGALFDASHASMREEYEITTPAVDLLVSIGRAHPDVYGARMTGGGFGGAVVMIARAGTAFATARAVAEDYRRRTENQPLVLVPATY